MSNWAELDDDVLVEIARRITWYEDFIAFRCVCSSWQSAAVKENFRFKSIQTPWLMLPPRSSTIPDDGFCDFITLSKGQIFRTTLPEIHSDQRYFWSKGWLITINHENWGWSIRLLHPFTRSEITFPSLTKWTSLQDRNFDVSNYIYKCFLSSNPLMTSYYIMMMIYDFCGKLAYAKPGDKTWTRIEGSSYVDVTYYKGKFYAIDAHYKITAIDVTSGNPSMIQVTQIQQFSTFRWDYERLYILESAGALMVVVRKLESDPQFWVFDIDVSKGTWTEVKDLGNKALFLGLYSSLSVQISHVSHCTANCLYFIQDRAERTWYSHMCWGGEMKRFKYVKIYNMQEGSIEKYYEWNSSNFYNSLMWMEQGFQ